MLRVALLTALKTALFTMSVTSETTTQTLPPAPSGDGLRGAYVGSAYLAQLGSHNH
jgi:hypothetical protein